MPPRQQVSLRQSQRDVVTAMIQSAVAGDNPQLLSASISSSSSMLDGAHHSGGDDRLGGWKLLIYDNVGKQVLAPLVKVKDLRDMGVTLHLPIEKQREPVPGAPAIYFCAPTEANINRIAQDCIHELYPWVYVNFTAPVPRRLLEVFAELLAAEGKLSSIRHIKVVDRTLGFVALANDMFTLCMPHAFTQLSSRHTSDAEMHDLLQHISMGVTHAVLATQSLPVIAFAKGGPAQEVANRVSSSLFDLLNDRTFVPKPVAALGRPLLLLVDRSSDLTAALHHAFTYRGLLVDAVGMRLNKVDVMGGDGKEKSYEMDPDADVFYRANGGADFASVGANVDAALAEYKREVAQYSADHGGSAHGDTSDAAAMSKMLANAPKLAEKKRTLDAHTSIAYSILKKINENSLDGFHGVEFGILSRDGMDHDHFVNLMQGPAPIEDKQRLFLVAYLMAESDAAAQELEKEFLQHVTRQQPQQPSSTAGGTSSASPTAATSASSSSPVATAPKVGGFPALQYVKHLQSWSMGASHGLGNSSASAASTGWGFAQTLAKGIAASLKGATEVEFPLTRMVDALLQDVGASSGSRGSASASVRSKVLESVGAVDPKTKHAVDISEVRFHQVLVFVVGGGSVNEFDDLKKWEAKQQHRKSVIFGSTELLSGNEFLDQLSALGVELKP